MIKIVAITLIIAFVILLIKGFDDKYALLLGLASSVLLLLLSNEYIAEIFMFFTDLIDKSGIDDTLLRIVFKVTGIGYLIEFSAGIIEDAGLKNLSDKLVFIGKIMIIATALPVFYAVFTMFTEMFT